MSQPAEIALIGAGPAGLTAAVILCRHGHKVRVYEAAAAPAQRAQGGSLDLHADKGQLALHHAGLLQAFRAIARHEDQQERAVDPISGQVIAGAAGPDRQLDRPEIDRGVLLQLLLDALPASVVQWGKKLQRVDASASGPHRLIFNDGAEASADVVIGADGAWSRVRTLLTAVQPRYTGITFFEGWIAQPTAAQASLVGRGTMFALGGPQALIAQRNGAGRLCVYAALRNVPKPWHEARSGAALKPLLRARYAGWAAPLLALFDACADFSARPIFTLPAPVQWTPRRGISLIGDAAHLMPPVGLGVNLAMLDAAEMALALCDAPDPYAALHAVESQICQRANCHMAAGIEGFSQWFGPA
ncbi:FAD-dependent oxidoreductase [Amantichitinum ursilacus]|uniref:FAD-dependent urate hydroxylase n=1 Tax=Amantichitinum ursilacus TaxID=857265 RepID=A0A0N0XGB8_9NEIS|nr:NAD(P)/FAD-dependent oxidoreductase [Amantichitinum ursilacus]KPC49631.1 FAD-dependent urate hydroxylase [Amantichitinum ursilacus]